MSRADGPSPGSIDYVSSKRLLLVLDNCEHLIDACAVLSDAILREAPGLRILATSRQPLGVAGETVIQVGPLSVPEDEGQLVPERIAQWDAIALLVERAREAGAAFEVTPGNQSRRGRAGAPPGRDPSGDRARVCPPPHPWPRSACRATERPVPSAGRGSRTAPLRHQTLEATIAWSHDLLGQDERGPPALPVCVRRFVQPGGGRDGRPGRARR